MRERLRHLIGRLPPRLQWAPHNLLAHPIAEVLRILTGRSTRAGDWLHDATIPPEAP